MRGKLTEGLYSDANVRITPAGAGKTQSRKARRLSAKDHPRRCGENQLLTLHTTKTLGSPPQVRGKLLQSTLRLLLFRITPAGAGKTPTVRPMYVISRDHPRRCGENVVEVLFESKSEGSPPQVRGKRETGGKMNVSWRITPAGAGKTLCRRFLRCGATDHPRRCGENASAEGLNLREKGSPPQVRGKLPPLVDFGSTFRITPAGAGKTETIKAIAAADPDHPRRCGEND